MNEDRDASVYFNAGAIARTPEEIAGDPTLSNARKIELLKSLKEHHAAPQDKDMQRAADLELAKLLKLND
ncbi:hypothetical protein [Pelagibacterium mangrovi]|uniref:hypothetical protein n=1 Tax=Pelagibacterium mangrovi TaxID=3119828 RepID=UPI002FCBA3D8